MSNAGHRSSMHDHKISSISWLWCSANGTRDACESDFNFVRCLFPSQEAWVSRTPSLIWAELELSSGEGGGFGRETLISSQVELIYGIFYPEVISPLICKNILWATIFQAKKLW